MTKEEILTMEPGPELDTLVAKKVMNHPMPDFIPGGALDLYLAGTPIHYDSWMCVCRYDEGDVPKWVPDPYSSDISAAWQVFDKIKDDGLHSKFIDALCDICDIPHYGGEDAIHIAFYIERLFEKLNAETICKAALIAKGVGD